MAPDAAGRIRAWAVREGLFRRLARSIAEHRQLRTVADLSVKWSSETPSNRDVSFDEGIARSLLTSWLEAVPAGIGDTKRRAIKLLIKLVEEVRCNRASVQLLDGNERSHFVSYGHEGTLSSRTMLSR